MHKMSVSKMPNLCVWTGGQNRPNLGINATIDGLAEYVPSNPSDMFKIYLR